MASLSARHLRAALSAALSVRCAMRTQRQRAAAGGDGAEPAIHHAAEPGAGAERRLDLPLAAAGFLAQAPGRPSPRSRRAAALQGSSLAGSQRPADRSRGTRSRLRQPGFRCRAGEPRSSPAGAQRTPGDSPASDCPPARAYRGQPSWHCLGLCPRACLSASDRGGSGALSAVARAVRPAGVRPPDAGGLSGAGGADLHCLGRYGAGASCHPAQSFMDRR